MEDQMAQMIVFREFNWSRPNSRFSFHAMPSEEPQSRVHDFVDAAVAAGAAKRVKPKSKRVVEEKDVDQE